MGEPLNVGIIGCGKIIAQYLETFQRLDDVCLIAVADIDDTRSQAIAESTDGVTALSVDELLRHPTIAAVVNLTIPAVHADVSLRIIDAGKSVYVEKPLTATTSEARTVLAAAANAGVVLGCAPDTVLGTGFQTARQAIDEGLIGSPIAATATMVTPGHERWHPDPDFYYLPGGGPLLDMGPYYITALVSLIGPVDRVLGAASATRLSRTIHTGPRAGETIAVSTPSHVTGVLVHESGALSTILTSFDAVATKASNIEVHGELGTLSVPDPNKFSGDVHVRELGGSDWRQLPVSAGYRNASRGYGLADMIWSHQDALAETGRTVEWPGSIKPRASGALAYHVLDIMESLLQSAETGNTVDVLSTASRPEVVALTER